MEEKPLRLTPPVEHAGTHYGRFERDASGNVVYKLVPFKNIKPPLVRQDRGVIRSA